MSSLSFIKKPVTDIRKCVESVQEMNDVKRAYEKGDLTALSYERKLKDNKIRFVKNALPLATTALTASLLGCSELFEGFQNGAQFSDVVFNQFGTITQLFNSSFNENSKPVIDELSTLDSQVLSEYCSYVGKGTLEFLSKMKDEYVNTSYVVGLVSVYGTMNALTGGINFLAGDSKDMHKLRDMDTENMKLKILRKHYHDPVFDSLNNEEMYSMMVTFNKTLHNYHMGKKKIIKNIIGFVDRVGSSLLTPFRKVFNTSTNGKKKMANAVFNYIENDINFDKPELTYEKYGIKKEDFKILASYEGGVTKKEMIDYVFKTNNKAMVNAYKMKLKDDTILAFALKLEEISNAPKITQNHVSDIMAFETFISGYERNKSHLDGLKLPDDLKEMSSILKLFKRNNAHSLQRVVLEHKGKNYTKFLERNAPHLVTRHENQNKVDINNYSFLSYFEAEKERALKKELLVRKVSEYTEARQHASENRDRVRYEKLDQRIKGFEKEILKYNHIFGKKSIESEVPPEDIMPKQISTISSIYRDPSLSHDSSVESFVVNHMLNKEKNLLEGEGLKERGIDLIEAERIQEFGELSEYKFEAERERSLTESRSDFKKNGKNFQKKLI